MNARIAPIRTPLALASLVLLAACGSLAPPVPVAQPGLPATFNAAAPTEAPPPPPAPAAHAWDTFFTDPGLRQVVGLALSGNRPLRASAAAVERARVLLQVVRAPTLPEIEANASTGRQRNAGATTGTASVGLSLSAWEIDLFNRLGDLRDAALLRFEAQQETQRAAQLSLVAETAAAWLQVAATRQQLTLAEALRDSQQRTLALTQRQYDAGAVSGLQLARAQAAFEAARGNAVSAVTAARQARLALELLAGQPVPEAWLPRAQADVASALPTVPEGLPATVLLQRPDLRAAERALAATSLDIGAARAERFPRITLTAAAGRRSSDLEGLVSNGSGFWSLLPQLELPLFDAGLRAARADAAVVAQRAAVAQYEAALQAAFRDVADALAVREGLQERLAAQRAQVEAADRSLRLAEASYRAGAASQLDLLDAQRQQAASQQGLVALRLLEQVNRVTLLRALGGGWPPGAGT